MHVPIGGRIRSSTGEPGSEYRPRPRSPPREKWRCPTTKLCWNTTHSVNRDLNLPGVNDRTTASARKKTPNHLTEINGQPLGELAEIGTYLVNRSHNPGIMIDDLCPKKHPSPETETANAPYIVNVTTDLPDVLVGDGLAQDVNGNTSLRAAIMEGNGFTGRQCHDQLQLGQPQHDQPGHRPARLNKNFTINGPGQLDLMVQRSAAQGTATSGYS